MVEVPVVWEILPGGGLVAVAAGAVGFIGLVGLGLVFQDLWDEAMVGLGGDEDVGQHQGPHWSTGGLLAFVFLDSP